MKRIARCLVVVVLLVFTLCPLAYASDGGSFVDKVDAADQKISQLIDEAVAKADRTDKESEIHQIINDLRAETREIVYTLEKEAKVEGIKLIHEYEIVEIGGHNVRIDPCRVAGV